MATPLEILIKNINDDNLLSENEKKEFLLVVDMIPEEFILDINNFTKNDKEFISFLWSNIFKKRDALIKKDNEAIKDIIKEEIDFVNKN
jgi:hypothetical protein